MKISRRDFLLLTAGLAAGCQTANTPSMPADGQPFNAGPADGYSIDGVYSRFRDRGFFVVRQGDKLFALSAICTHRKCKLTANPNHSFYCPCHGSTFDPNGHVTNGPAQRDLPVYSVFVDEKGQLLVKT